LNRIARTRYVEVAPPRADALSASERPVAGLGVSMR
jgi:hypothetical protein